MNWIKRNIKKIRQIIAMGTIILGLTVSFSQTLAQREYWCPPCSSDACQSGGASFLMIVGGTCYCCFEISN
jgi:uncharacterized protein (UPF0303 family)